MAKQAVAREPVRVYSAFDPPPAVDMDKFEESKTRQADVEEVEINRLLARFQQTGVMLPPRVDGVFADISEMGDFRTAIHQVHEAETLFMQLPAEVRAKFENDPAAFLDAALDPARRDEMVKLGIYEAPSLPPAPPAEAPKA